MRRDKIIATLFLPTLLAGCFDENAKHCQSLSHDSSKRMLALDYCQKAAEAGDTLSQLQLGKLLLADNHLQQAVGWLKKSANQNEEAQFLLGELHESGKLDEANLISAKFYYEKSCQLGSLKACERLNLLVEKQKAEQAKALEAEKAKARQEAKEVEQKKFALEQQKIDAQRKLLEEQKQMLNEERKLREQQLAEERRLLEERKRLEMQQNSPATQTPASERRDTTGLKFFDGLAAFTENGLYGFVNHFGEVVIKPQFAYAGRFSRGRSAVQLTHNNLWGFIDTRGNYVVYPRYCVLGAFSESDGLAGVYEGGYKSGNTCVGGKWGFMDTAGKWVINPELDYVERFIQGKAKVTYQGRTGFINRYGQWVE